jgi:hypothetical protein
MARRARQAGPVRPAAPKRDLVQALTRLRELVASARLPLDTDGADAARREAAELLGQLDDYVLPRVSRLDAPLLAVVGGSTGAGKSTLVNSVVGEEVTAPGVLRPTTRSPVLVHNPADQQWFADTTHILPGLARTTGAAGDPGSLRLVASKRVPAGLGLLDAPDIDSVVSANRELAGQLLAAADLWVFVTTAARYADAVPWDLLRTASARSTAVAVVLDRTAPAAVPEIRAHLAQMLRDEGLGASPLLVVPEVPLVRGLLPDPAVEPVRRWLHELASDAAARAAVVRRTLGGVLDSYRSRVPRLAKAVTRQQLAEQALREAVSTAYADAAAAVDDAMRDGSLLRGEVLARWQEFVGTGELLRALETRVGRLRDRLTSAVRGRPAPAEELTVALESGVEALVRAHADEAADRAAAAWRRTPAGAALLEAADDDLSRSSSRLSTRIERTVRDWQGSVLEMVREEGAGKRSGARFLAYGINGSGLLVMVAVFASTGGLTGTEVVVAGGASALSQKIIEALLGDQAVRELAAKARADLAERVDVLLVDEQERFHTALDAAVSGQVDAGELLAAGKAVEKAR